MRSSQPESQFECGPNEHIAVARRPRHGFKRKPPTEIVVEMGPYTHGQITDPNHVHPTEGPSGWLIRPKTGEIVPFDNQPPAENVIRKYINVEAQDPEGPRDLPLTHTGYVISREINTDLPHFNLSDHQSTYHQAQYVENFYQTVTCTDMPSDTPVTPSGTPAPTVTPSDPTPGPTDGPTDQPTDQPTCQPHDHDHHDHSHDGYIHAHNDCATTPENQCVTIDVLKNDHGTGQLTLTDASASHGTVSIVNGMLQYTPDEGFTGHDQITYSVSNSLGMSDSANVDMNVVDPNCQQNSGGGNAYSEAAQSAASHLASQILNQIFQDSSNSSDHQTSSSAASYLSADHALSNEQWASEPNQNDSKMLFPNGDHESNTLFSSQSNGSTALHAQSWAHQMASDILNQSTGFSASNHEELHNAA